MNKLFKFFCNALPLICSITACIYISLGGTPLFIVDASSSFHFSLITVNALFGGFLYTNYSLLLGVLDNPIIEKVKNTNIIHKRNSHILKGITYATISVIAGLYLILAPINNSKFWKLIYCFMQNAEIIFMFFLIILCFIFFFFCVFLFFVSCKYYCFFFFFFVCLSTFLYDVKCF